MRSCLLRSVAALSLVVASACGGSPGSTGTLQQRAQGSWNLTGLTCDTTDLSSLLGGALTMSASVSGTSYTMTQATSGCTLTDQGTVTFDDAAGTIVITPSGPPSCNPAACDSGCSGSGSGPSGPINVSISGSTMVLTASGSTFPNNVCERFPTANPPGKATFTKQ